MHISVDIEERKISNTHLIILSHLCHSDSEEHKDSRGEDGVRHASSRQESLQEKELQKNACDYTMRFCGHCNTTTDIKEANFFGRFVFLWVGSRVLLFFSILLVLTKESIITLTIK